MNTDEKHKYYDRAVRAYSNTSFMPEKRALRECQYYDEICDELNATGKEWAIERFTRLFEKYLSSQSRCASWAIVGPARFPVARMEKYNRWAHNALTEMTDYIEKVRKPKPEPRKEIDYNIEAKKYQIGDVSVIQNTDDNRLQLLFPNKPERETIERLKSRGFKWSPRNKAWQRQLTPNALRALSWVFIEA